MSAGGNPDWLREHTDEELLVLAREMYDRREAMDSGVLSVLNDELRRRKLPPVGPGESRF